MGRRTAILSAAILTALAGLAPGATDAAPASASAAVLLPDLAELAPTLGAIVTPVIDGRRVQRLGVGSGVANIGPGPLLLRGARGSGTEMRATQFLRTRGGGQVAAGYAGRMRYARTPDHSHWHLLAFERYELRTLSGRRLAGDHKSGFCVGDRDRERVAGVPPRPSGFPGQCGRGRPDLRIVHEGLSVGWSDTYAPQIEGQYVTVTGIPDGVYWLVNRVDPAQRLRDANRSNDVSGLRIRLEHLGDGPRFAAALRACRGSSCPAAVTHR